MCSQCIKSKRKCLGYRDLSNVVFRNETQTTKLKATRNQYSRHSIGLSTESPQLHGNTTGPRREDRTHNVVTWPTGLSNAIPRALLESWQQAAICFFLPNFIEAGSLDESPRDFMVYLPPLYTNAKPNSTLAAVTSALSFQALAGATGRFELRTEAMKQYGIAMARMNRTLTDPSEVKGDATLLSVLLFALFEDFICSVTTLPLRSKHAQGAMALIRNRGREILQNPRSLKLLNTVHYQTLVNHIFLCEPIDALDFIYTIDDWSKFPAVEKDKATNRLTFLTLNIPNLRAAARKIFSIPQCNEKVEMVKEVMADAISLDQKLSAWPSEAPETWRFDSVAYVHELDTIETAEAYYGPVHKYPDLRAAFTYNKWRTCMILTHVIILNCAEWLSRTLCITMTEQEEAKLVLRTMVDEICASVPFQLGFISNEMGEKDAIDPHIVGNFALRLGGYYLIWPLFVAGSVGCIPETQKMWLKHRLAHIGQREGSGRNQASVLSTLTPYTPCSGPILFATDFLHSRAEPLAEASELSSG